MSALLLKHASASRPSGEWGEDDYDVLCEREVVGRMMKAAAAPVGSPLAVDAGLRLPRRPYADTQL
jgi:hypothetical protein